MRGFPYKSRDNLVHVPRSKNAVKQLIEDLSSWQPSICIISSLLCWKVRAQPKYLTVFRQVRAREPEQEPNTSKYLLVSLAKSILTRPGTGTGTGHCAPLASTLGTR